MLKEIGDGQAPQEILCGAAVQRAARITSRIAALWRKVMNLDAFSVKNLIVASMHIDNAMERSRRVTKRNAARRYLRTMVAAFVALCLCALPAFAQSDTLTGTVGQDSSGGAQAMPAPSGAPPTFTLADALARAQKNSPEFQRALAAVKIAHGNQVQARAAMLPSIGGLTQYLNTQGNDISPVGRFVTNDGVHVYRAWATAHQDLPAGFFMDLGPRKAAYQKAVADAGAQIAKRSLVVTVTQDYYALLVAQRAYAVAQQTLASSQNFLRISQQLEQGGEVARQEVIRFQLQASQAQRDLDDSKLAMSQARLNLAVLLFPTFNEDFSVVDDLDTPPVLPGFQQAEAMAKDHNPEVAAALASYDSARIDVASARTDFLPSFSVDVDYGIEANHFALRSVNTTSPDRVENNLGYFVTYSMNIPVWDWGARISKLHQAEEQRSVAKLDMLFAQRRVLSELRAYYDESQVAWNQLATLRQSVDLAQQNFQLVTLQYQAGEASVLEVLDAETTLAGARDSYATGEARYRNALATLQTITGSF
jgi:outer membrane protein TolC